MEESEGAENNSQLSEEKHDTNSSPTLNIELMKSHVEQQMEEEDATLALSKGRQKSVVWEHFEKKKIDGIDKAQCNYCKKLLGGNPKNGTKHLHDHFKRCPRRKVVDLRQKVLTTNLKKGNGEMCNYSFNQDCARRQLAHAVILHEYPLSIVDHVGFRRYSNSLQRLFKCPTRNTLKSDILNIYDSEKDKTVKLLETNESRIAITTDMWTSMSKKGFMAITSHFIDSNWVLQSRILRFAYVPCPHTSEVLSKVLIDCLMDWNVDTKLSTITLDNCSTNDAMVNILRNKLQVNSLLRHGSLLHMRCCAHILNLIVKDGLDIIGDGITKIRNSVLYWTTTPKRYEKFEEAARQLRIPLTKKLSFDCPTRWNSTFLMLQTALLYKIVFARLRQREPQYIDLPHERDWLFAEEICTKLKLFYNVTEIFSGTKYPTANMYFSKICEIKLALNQWLVSHDQTISEMALKMLSKFDKYWSSVHEIMGVAVVLDPRYKMSLLEFYFPRVYGTESSVQIDNIRLG